MKGITLVAFLASAIAVTIVYADETSQVELEAFGDGNDIAQTKIRAVREALAKRKDDKSKKKNHNSSAKGKPGGKKQKRRNKTQKGKKNKSAKQKRRNKTQKNKKNKSAKQKRRQKNKQRRQRKLKNKQKKAAKRQRKNKNKDTKSKKNKKNRNGKKGKSSSKRRRNKKAKRRQRKRMKGKKRNNGGKAKSSTRQFSEVCVKSLAKLVGQQGVQIRNLERQLNKIETFDNQIKSKANKSGDFKDDLGFLESVVGNVTLGPKCKGAALDTAQNETLSTLSNCEKDIKGTCSSTLSRSNKTFLAECKTKLNALIDALKPIYNVATSAAQICSAAVAITNGTALTDIQACLTFAQPQFQKSKTEKTTCQKRFSKCRQAEREVSKDVFNCKPVSSGLPDIGNKTEAEKQLKALEKLDGTLAQTEKKFGNALKDAGLDKGPGDDGVLPADVSLSRYVTWLSRRSKRQTNETGNGCDNVLKEWQNFNKSADAAAKESDSSFNSDESEKATTALDNINSRPSLTDDLKSCNSGTSGRQIQASFRIIIIRFYVFWCINWRIVVVQVKIVLIVITFNIPTTTTTLEPTTPTTPTTTQLVTNSPNKRRANIQNFKIFQ